jgi:hypothetical protein
MERLQSQEPIVLSPSPPSSSERQGFRLEDVPPARKKDDGNTYLELESPLQDDERVQIEQELKK